jgi:hypothetical protein
LILCDCCFNIKWSEFIYIRDKHKVTNIKVTRAMQSVVYPLTVKPLKISKFNCDLDLWPMTLKINRVRFFKSETTQSFESILNWNVVLHIILQR